MPHIKLQYSLCLKLNALEFLPLSVFYLNGHLFKLPFKFNKYNIINRVWVSNI